MSSEKMEELSIKELISSYNFIIPEIQREYVWGNRDIVNSFIDDILAGFKNIDQSKKDHYELKADNLKELSEQYDKIISNHGMNIGFLYSYRPSYSFNDNAQEDVYLIDGQQRFTTIFLLLFYLDLKSNKEFTKLLRFNSSRKEIAFDYRVRDTTHNFMIKMIEKCTEANDLVEMVNRTWFLAEYKNDPTIQAMIAAIKKIDEKLKDADSSKLFDFVFENIKFWHFKTEATSQGEELYITMNSRGESLKDYENIKAVLFDKVEGDKKEWGTKWELWQDFFWKYKGDDENADKGFDEFLKWVEEIEKTIQKKDNFKVTDLAISVVEKYFISLKFLIEKCMTSENSPAYCELEKYNDFIAKDISKIDKNKVALFPVLIYLKSKYTSSIYDKKYNFNIEADIDDFRVIRFFSNISKFSGAVKEAVELASTKLGKGETIFGLLNDFVQSTYKSILTEEEVFKLSIYKDAGDQREKYEEAFWRAEDHKDFNGRISSLLNLCKDSYLLNFDRFNSLYKIYLMVVSKNNKELYNLAILANALNLDCGRRSGAGGYDYLDVEYIEKILLCNKDWFNNPENGIWQKLTESNYISIFKEYILEKLNRLKNIDQKHNSWSSYYQKIWLAYEIARMREKDNFYDHGYYYELSLNCFDNENDVKDENKIFIDQDFSWGNLLMRSSRPKIQYFQSALPMIAYAYNELKIKAKDISDQENKIEERKKDISNRLKEYYNFDLQ